jgi:hypothetical protein
MNNTSKIGHVLKDDHIKKVKKLFKKKLIKCEGKVWGKKIQIEITNVRKYRQGYYLSKEIVRYCYELDVKVKFTDEFGVSESWVKNNKRGINSRVRNWSNEKLLQDELQFFGIENICVSKIQYV